MDELSESTKVTRLIRTRIERFRNRGIDRMGRRLVMTSDEMGVKYCCMEHGEEEGEMSRGR